MAVPSGADHRKQHCLAGEKTPADISKDTGGGEMGRRFAGGFDLPWKRRDSASSCDIG